MNKKIIAAVISIVVVFFFLIFSIISSTHIYHYEIIFILYCCFILTFFSFIFIGKVNIKPVYIYLLGVLLIFILRFYNKNFYEVVTVVIVPRNFQGRVNVVFGVKGSPALLFQKHLMYIEQSNDSIICTSTKVNKTPHGIIFTYDLDTLTSINDNPSGNFSLDRCFVLGYDTLEVNKKVFTYFSAFITKGFHKDTDSIVVENMQFSNLHKVAIKEAIMNIRKKDFP